WPTLVETGFRPTAADRHAETTSTGSKLLAAFVWVAEDIVPAKDWSGELIDTRREIDGEKTLPGSKPHATGWKKEKKTPPFVEEELIEEEEELRNSDLEENEQARRSCDFGWFRSWMFPCRHIWPIALEWDKVLGQEAWVQYTDLFNGANLEGHEIVEVSFFQRRHDDDEGP
ncbi:MAG: hypothetical protein MMC23_009154, partial [Stictis urceolatum]|nr:hypothetical protein [Stictis urceolata]